MSWTLPKGKMRNNPSSVALSFAAGCSRLEGCPHASVARRIWKSSAYRVAYILRRLQALWLKIEMLFGLLYLAELLVKVMAEGARHYWRSAANKFDCLVTMGIVITQVNLKLLQGWSSSLCFHQLLGIFLFSGHATLSGSP